MVFEKNTLKELLGHSSSKTTEIYTHVSNKLISQVVSPFDELGCV
jgi:integrase/recombinase XerD